MNQRIIYFLLALFATGTFIACDDYETYAEQKDKERDAINSYLSRNNIQVISEEQFLAQDTTTDITKNQYVLFGTTGVYMQIIHRGCGEIIKDGESVTVLSRFNEYNLKLDSLTYTNNNSEYGYLEDKYDVRNVSGTFYASFDTNQSRLYAAYSSASVPAGWLVPLTYVKLGRPTTENDTIASVRIIVPHDQGHSTASSNVTPYLYELTYMRGI